MAELAETARRMTRASAGSGLTTIWSAALGLFTAPFIIHHLGVSQYGIFALISIVSSYLTNLEFGFGHATVRFLAKAHAENDEDAQAAVIGNSLAIFIPGALLAGGVTLFGASFIVRHFAHGPEALHETFVHAIQLGAPIIAVAMLNTCCGAALQALGRWGFLVTSSWIVGSLLSISAVTVVALGGGLTAVIATQLVLNSLLALVSFFVLARTTSASLLPRFQRDTFMPMARFSVIVMFAGIASQTMVQGPPAVLAAYKATADVAAFGISNTVFQQLAGIVGASGLGFLPFASAASSVSDRTVIRAIYTANLRLTVLVLAPLTSFIVVFAHPLLAVWISTSFANRASDPLRFMVAASLILGLSSPPSDLARGFGHAKFVTAYAALAAMAALALSFLAVPRYGASGAAFALCVGMAIVTVPYVFVAGAWMIGLRPTSLARSLRGPIGGLGLVALLYEIGLRVTDSFASAIITGAVGFIVYSAVAITWLIDERERRILMSLSTRRFRLRRARPARDISAAADPGLASTISSLPSTMSPRSSAASVASGIGSPSDTRHHWGEMTHTMRRRRAAWMGICLGLLLLAWAMSSQPFSAPDEGPHYLRALTLANGHLLGPKVPYQNSAESPAEVAFASHDTRAVWVPAGMSPPGFHCVNGSRAVHGCLEATPTGDYYPLPYLLPALAVGVSNRASTGLWLARVGSAFICAAMLLIGFAVLWDEDLWSVIGLLGALTPMVLFVASVLNPSGLEITSSLAFAATSLRVARSGIQTPSVVWLALAVTGAALLLSFQASPIYAMFDILLAASFMGLRPLLAVAAAHRRECTGLAGVLLVALIVWVIYSKTSGVSHSDFGVSPLLPSLKAATSQMRTVIEQAVGDFGALSVPLSGAAYVLWLLFVAALIVGALVVGTARERIVTGVAVTASFAFPVLANAWIYRHSGFAMQARQVLPALLLAPLAAGEVLWHHVESLRTSKLRATPVCVAGFVMLFQLYAWFVNERTSPGGGVHVNWSPPMGRGVWIAVAIVSTLGLLRGVAPATSSLRSRKSVTVGP